MVRARVYRLHPVDVVGNVLAAAILAFVLAGCAMRPPPPPVHVVTVETCPAVAVELACPPAPPALEGAVPVEALKDALIDWREALAVCRAVVAEWREEWQACQASSTTSSR